MQSTNATKKSSSDPRPTYIHLGTDGLGLDHVYHTPTESVFEIAAATGQRTARRALGNDPVGVYVDAIEAERGWAHCRYGLERQYARLGEAVREEQRDAEVA